MEIDNKKKCNIIKLFEDCKAESRYVKISAPMVRYSKLEFRQLLRKYGTELCFSPMIIADSFCRSQECRNNEFTTSQYDSPLIAQFAAKSSSEFVSAAQLIYPYCDGVDLNCGCPQTWALKKGYGCSLLKNPDILFQTIRELRNSIPNMQQFTCSYKIRLLENQQVRKTIDLCQQLESCGLSFLTIHGRTSWQKYTEPCNYEAISNIKKSMKIPIICNGDIKTCEDANLVFKHTLCDGIMVARSLLTNPMLFDDNQEKNVDINVNNISEKNNQPSEKSLINRETNQSNVENMSSDMLKLDLDFKNLQLIKDCIVEWIILNLNNTEQQYQTFHHHLVFMLEKYLNKRQRLEFNKLTKKVEIYNFLNNKFHLKINISNLPENIFNLSSLIDSRMFIQDAPDYFKINQNLIKFTKINKISLDYDNNLIRKYILNLEKKNCKKNLEIENYINNSQNEGNFFNDFKLKINSKREAHVNEVEFTEDSNELYFTGKTIFDT